MGVDQRETLNIFHPETILTQNFSPLTPSSCRMTYTFPAYRKMQDYLPHVTMPQIHEAIFEGLFLTTAHVIRTGALQLPLSYEIFLVHRLQAIIREEQLKFRQMLSPQTPADLVMSLRSSEIRKRFAAITIGVEGFVEGEVTFLIPLTLISPNTTPIPPPQSP